MQTTRPVARVAKGAIGAALIANLLLPGVAAAGEGRPQGLMVAQGGFEKLPPSVAPTPYSPNAQPSTSPSTSLKTDHNSDSPTSSPERSSSPNSSSDTFWGAIAFTADGSYSSTWKMPSQPEAEAKVLRQCARFGRGGCEVVSFSGQECVSLATFIGSYRRRRWNLSYTAGGMTYPTAQGAAMDRCNSDERTQGRCQSRTTACADGR